MREDRCYSTGGGILYLIKENITFYKINSTVKSNHEIEKLGICITNTNPIFNIISFYRPPGVNLSQERWTGIISSAKNKNENKTIIMGDFNAHHRAWNCTSEDINGRPLFDYIQSQDLVIHNQNTYSRINLHTGNKSNLD